MFQPDLSYLPQTDFNKEAAELFANDKKGFIERVFQFIFKKNRQKM